MTPLLPHGAAAAPALRHQSMLPADLCGMQCIGADRCPENTTHQRATTASFCPQCRSKSSSNCIVRCRFQLRQECGWIPPRAASTPPSSCAWTPRLRHLEEGSNRSQGGPTTATGTCSIARWHTCNCCGVERRPCACLCCSMHKRSRSKRSWPMSMQAQASSHPEVGAGANWRREATAGRQWRGMSGGANTRSRA